MSNNITISEIARLANVSKTTVSRVLNNKPDVQPETREKIKRLIEELDYQPNIFAKGISNKKSHTIGLLIPYSANYIFSNPFYYEIIRGVSNEANKKGYYILFCYSEEDNYLIALRQKRFDGVIVVSPGKEHKRLFDEIIDADVPVVAISKVPGMPEIKFVDTDNFNGAFKAVEHLISLGHKKIGYINGPESLASSTDRFEGYKKALESHGIAYDEKLIEPGDTSINSGFKAMQNLIQSNSGISAVFVASDLMAVGVINAINSAGKKVPDDISVVGFDDIPLAGSLNPPLTTVRQFSFERGELTARMIIDLIEEKPIDYKTGMNFELIIRSSTKDISDKKIKDLKSKKIKKVAGNN